jgi:hypothetical protein
MIGLIFEFIGSALGEFLFTGWRWVFSPSYREEMRLRWKGGSQSSVAMEIAGGILGVVLTLLGIAVLVWFWLSRLGPSAS